MARVQVKVQEGILEGHVLKTSNGFPYRSFTGIPFAKPPIGELRFKDPVPIENWNGVYDATKESKVCAQFEVLFRKIYLGEEDCLYLNVFVPEGTKQDAGLPVMFWVHGGAYSIGSGNPDVYGPEYLIQHNVIIVSTNYRVGALGFLCLDIEEAPGNVGIKDQALALKWVNQNIAKFGGDPQNVTIFGESAGGSSTHYLILSPVTKGLYSKAIMQSGTATCEWVVQTNHQEIAFKLGEKLGMKTNDKSALIKFLHTVPVEKLVMAALSPDLGDGITLAFAPVIEKKIPKVTTFLSEDSRQKILDGNFSKIPIMIGQTSEEGFYVLHIKTELCALLKKEVNMESLTPDFNAFIPKHLKNKLSRDKMQVAADKIKEYYFPTDDFRKQYMTFSRDFGFIKDVNFVAKAYSKFMPTYYYQFSFEGPLNIFKQVSSVSYKGASHADELAYLFHVKYDELLNKEVIPTEKDQLTIRRMTELWTNFAKFGNPTLYLSENISTKWHPIDSDKGILHCLNIGDELTMIKNPHADAMEFWNSLEKLAEKS